MSKLFCNGVANVFGYSPTSGDEIFRSKTLLDSSIDVKTANTPIRGGYGDSLQFVYFHTAELTGKITETQFSLNFIGANMGTSVSTGKNVWTEEVVTLTTGGAGSVVGTPLVQPDITGSNIYGWVTDKNGVTTKVTFTTKNFTLAGGNSGDVVTVRYFANNTAAQYIQVPANLIPSVVRLVMEAQLFSGDGTAAGSTLVGKIQIEINRAQLDGASAIALTAAGVSNTALTFMSLSNTDATGATYYATIAQILTNANWYDNVYAIISTADPITVNTVNSPYQLDLRAIPTQGSAFKPPYADITFTSSDATKATVDATGKVTKIAVGSCTITITITNKNTVSSQIGVTVA